MGIDVLVTLPLLAYENRQSKCNGLYGSDSQTELRLSRSDTSNPSDKLNSKSKRSLQHVRANLMKRETMTATHNTHKQRKTYPYPTSV